MGVGQYQAALAVHDDARSRGSRVLPAGLVGPAETEELPIGRDALALHHMGAGDVDHGGAVAWTALPPGTRGLESGTGAAAGAVAAQSRARRGQEVARRRPGEQENDGCMVNPPLRCGWKKDGKAGKAGGPPRTDSGDDVLLPGQALPGAAFPVKTRPFSNTGRHAGKDGPCLPDRARRYTENMKHVPVYREAVEVPALPGLFVRHSGKLPAGAGPGPSGQPDQTARQSGGRLEETGLASVRHGRGASP